jgi:hypothetical protein
MRHISLAVAWALAGAFAMLATAALAGVINAGDLDPPGPLGPTMQSLDDLVPAWHQELDAAGGCGSERFACVLGGAGVLDRETGLVWEATAGTANGVWPNAIRDCLESVTGERRGWRLPAAEELLSLKTTDASGLPAGHPFGDVVIDSAVRYWSSTTVPGDGLSAYAITFGQLNPQVIGKDVIGARTWCVRGGYGHDGH